MTWTPPTLPVSCGAIVTDADNRILVLKPSYKSGWTIPGGAMEADGESPWEACRREVLEETGLTVTGGRLVAVDTRPAKPGRPLGLRYLFSCGTVTRKEIDAIVLQEEEITKHRFVALDEALELLRPAVSRRVRAGFGALSCVYLENGRPVEGVS